MMHPALARDVHRALVAYAHVQRTNGQPLADGYGPYVEVVAAAMRADAPDHAPEWLTLDQAAERAHVAPRTLYGYRRAGLPWARAGGRVLIRRDDLDAWIAEDRQPSADLPADLGNRAA